MPQTAAKCLFVRNTYEMSMYELKPMNTRKNAIKTKLRPQKCISVFRHKTPRTSQTAARHRKTHSCSMRIVLSMLLNDQTTPSMDNTAATVIPGHCSVAVSTVDLEVTLLLGYY